MLHASSGSDVQLVGSNLGWSGGLGGSAGVQGLQQSLTSLSIAAGWPAADPGIVSGEVTPQTVMALAAVIGSLAKLPVEIRAALSVFLLAASSNTNAMAAAKNAIASQALTLQLAVIALIAKYTKSTPPPTAPKTGAPMSFFAPTTMMKAPIQPAASPLPAGSLQARTASGAYRVIVPESSASGLGGPAMSLGAAFFELPPRTAQSSGAILVTESELNNKLKPPFYKRPLYWAAIGGGLAVAGGAYWMIRR